jgi:hypothetical protein
MTIIPNFARMTRMCTRCHRYRPIAGGRKVATTTRGKGAFVCEACWDAKQARKAG